MSKTLVSKSHDTIVLRVEVYCSSMKRKCCLKLTHSDSFCSESNALSCKTVTRVTIVDVAIVVVSSDIEHITTTVLSLGIFNLLKTKEITPL